jgi:hypothetical protein
MLKNISKTVQRGFTDRTDIVTAIIGILPYRDPRVPGLPDPHAGVEGRDGFAAKASVRNTTQTRHMVS